MHPQQQQQQQQQQQLLQGQQQLEPEPESDWELSEQDLELLFGSEPESDWELSEQDLELLFGSEPGFESESGSEQEPEVEQEPDTNVDMVPAMNDPQPPQGEDVGGPGQVDVPLPAPPAPPQVNHHQAHFPNPQSLPTPLYPEAGDDDDDSGGGGGSSGNNNNDNDNHLPTVAQIDQLLADLEAVIELVLVQALIVGEFC
ncbi:hypothetical protein QBC45DRAFT_413944 [Copromyces sp. CBS 386.78]|nr:hypothetical protein QBC45DRAFT_413944 [Copromyces sp. CBS 386.78]